MSSFHQNEPSKHENTTPAWGAVFVMSLCCAVLIASEFMPVSLLTPISADLNMSEGQVGQAIAISGIFAVMTSLTISRVFKAWDRRHIILLLTLLMIVSGIVITFAHSAALFMLGRAILGVVIGGFWAMSTSIVMRLVPPLSVPKALGLLNGGNALATTIAAPLGSFLGSIIGWRGAFFCIVPIAIVALIWQFKSMPSLPAILSAEKSKNPFGLLKRPIVLYGMTGILLLFMGQFALFTYLRPFLETVTHVNASMLSILLLILGLAGLIGTFVISLILHQHVYRYLILIPLIMAAIAGAFVLGGENLWFIAILMGLWGFIGTSAPVAWNTWLAQTLHQDAEIGGGLMVAIIQFAITLGATIGGLLYDSHGYSTTFYMSATILLLGAITAYVTWHKSLLSHYSS
ncbi:TPA: MFS transporter [Acinetobacter baumannii]|uniref:MFS transporter n=1 Tax=Acinetobacter baumannii TaxID=470 RepID=UPI0001AF2807|nr:MFS transporter [Acinetobacter baumannii]EHU1904293.1 MFS transporter [Acinetobacter baumannii]EHU1920973.1 MFS transporter [Acinetobacter baumannii]EHU1965549.1 MFS transporter [Acinetobacter baumannii]EKP43874.1 putative purine ribonucleoside efflux pump NepI [Acinetobacter baumannii OIFC111]EKU3892489.1 MFS transporter [Acinetobacter baumannii]